MSDTEVKGNFYEERGLVRHMVILSPEHREILKTEAKKVKLTQGELLEVLLDNADFTALAGKLKEKKEGKTAGKLTKNDLLKRMKGLTPEQLAAIDAIVNK